MATDWNGLAIPDPYADRPVRVPRAVRATVGWIPLAVNVLAVGAYVLVNALRLRKGGTARRIATLVAGTFVLALAVFQMTPLGAMFDAWFLD
jgi:hypothetical protein